MEEKEFNNGTNTILLMSGTVEFQERVLKCLGSCQDLRLERFIVSKNAESQVGAEPTSIFVKEQDYYRRIDFHEIHWIEASGSYCFLYLNTGRKVIISFNLTELSTYLSSRIFMRVHRSYIVNIDHICSFVGNMLCVDKKFIPISKQHKKDVILRLNILGFIR